MRIETIGPGDDAAHTRTPDDEDRRQLIVTLTERGRAAAATQAAARAEIDAALAAAYRHWRGTPGSTLKRLVAGVARLVAE